MRVIVWLPRRQWFAISILAKASLIILRPSNQEHNCEGGNLKFGIAATKCDFQIKDLEIIEFIEFEW